MRPSTAPVTFAILLAVSTSAGAQVDRTAQFLDNCHNNSRRDNAQFCEVRTLTIDAGRLLSVDGEQNGGITVHGWDGAQTKVVAMIQTQAATEADANVIARAVSIAASGNELRAAGPDTRGYSESWSVSYEIWTPRRTDLSLRASNGGLSVDGIDSRMQLETTNGGLTLTDVDGDVHATTVNGGVTAQLSGDRWRGTGFDVRTSNGGVRVSLPANYSARLEASTVNGGVNFDAPITIQGKLGRSLSTTIGNGGALIRATTTNGGVTILRR